MPVKIPNALPATRVLTEENIFVMTETRSASQDIRALKILILNLMPTKEKTETQLLRLIGNTPLQVEITLLRTGSYQSQNTDEGYLKAFYRTLDDVRDEYFDGLVVTGAPVETLDFEDVTYWDELKSIMDWAYGHAFSTLYICWAAQAGLFFHYGIQKYRLPQKLFGVYDVQLTDRRDKLLRGFDDTFRVPMSRHTAVDMDAVHACEDLIVLAESPITGLALARSHDGRQIFATGHSEYDRDTLAQEYFRDLNKGLSDQHPENYYPNNDTTALPNFNWHSHANLLFANWLNYFVYQETPYELSTLSGRAKEETK